MARSGRAASSAPGVFRQEFIPQTTTADSPENEGEGSRPFWEQVYAVPEQDWWSGVHGEKGARVYLYYDEPGARYLAVVREPFDIEWVRAEYGGGAYKAMLMDVSNRLQAQTRFRIDGDPRKKPPQSVGVQPAPLDFQTQVLQILQEGQRRTEAMMERLIERDRSSSGSVAQQAQMEILPTVVGGVVKMFENLIPKPSNPLDDLLKYKELLGSQDIFSQLARFKELGLIGGGAAGDLLSQLDVVSKVAERLNITGGGSGKSLGEALIDKAPEVLKLLKDGITEYRMLEEKKLQTAQEWVRLQRGQPSPVITPAPSAPGPRVAQPPAAAPAAPPAPPAQPLQVEPITPGAAAAEAMEQQLNQLKAAIVQAIANGTSGADLFGFLKVQAPAFLNELCVFDGQKVTGVVSVDQLAQFCASDPVLKQAVQYPNFHQVLKELLSEVKFETMGIEEDAPDQPVG